MRRAIPVAPVYGRPGPPGPQGGQGEVGPQGPGGTGPQGEQGLPGVNAVANDTATAGYISTGGASATKTALQGKYGAETGAPAAVPSSFVAGGTGNTIAPVVARAKTPTNSHAEGSFTKVYDHSSHAEGTGCIADGLISHAEGNNSICSANDSHAEGNRTVAGRRYYPSVTTGSEDAGDGLGVLQYVLIPTAEGDATSHFPNPLTDNVTTRYGAGAQKDVKGNIYTSGHVPAVWSGDTPTTPNDLKWALHPTCIVRGSAEGEIVFVTIAKAVYSGFATKVYYLGAKPFTTLIGIYSSYAPTVVIGGTESGNGQHSEGLFTSSFGYGSHAEGVRGRAWGTGSHAEGSDTQALTAYAHAEGYFTKVTGAWGAHAEGHSALASGDRSHAEGYLTTASGSATHAEGEQTTASGDRAHAEGYQSTASGAYAHAEGRATLASGTGTRATGAESIASRNFQDAWSAGKRLVNGDNQVSRIIYNNTFANAGWHAVSVFNTLANDRAYHFETMVLGRQTAGTAGTVGDTFAYKFSGVVTVAAGVMTTLGTIERVLRGRSSGMSGDGLTTGPRFSAYTVINNGNLVLRFDGLVDTTFYVTTHSVVQELG